MTADGEVIVSWGAPGTGPGEFNLPHDVTVDHNDRVYILDRGNLRCQIFNNNGEYLTEWTDLRSPNDLFIDSDNIIHIAEGGQRISIMTLEGEVIERWGEKGDAPGQFSDSPQRYLDRFQMGASMSVKSSLIDVSRNSQGFNKF